MTSDDLFRSAQQTGPAVTKALGKKAGKNDVELFRDLGRLSEAASAGELTPTGEASGESFDRSALSDEAQALGSRIFRRWSRAFHDFLCNPDDEDKDVKEKLFAAITRKDGGAVALTAGLLIVSFGASPALAAVVATLLYKLIFQPAGGEICDYWKDHL